MLRLISQYFIVLYHLYLLFIAKIDDDPLNKAIQMPLHVGVIIFVLLSGYFSIRATSQKLVNLLAIFLVYTLPETFYTVDIIGNATHYLYDHISNGLLLFGSCMFLTLLIIFSAIAIDKLLTPLWNRVNVAGRKLYLKLGY